MNKREVIWRIKSNKIDKKEAITLLSDFLVISKAEAKRIYEEEFGK